VKIILGAVISLPPVSAGCAWNRLQYVLGLRQLGHEVVFVEEVRPEWCVNADGRRCAYADSENRRGFVEIMRRFDLLDHGCQIYNAGEATTGLSRGALTAFAADADLLIDISGHVTSDFVLDAVARRAYLDQDPVYTQLWRAEYGKDLRLERYDVFFTVGLNIGTPHSPIPDCGITWHHTLPPVVLDVWPVLEGRAGAGEHFTTVASLYGYSDLQFRGEWYRTKYDEFCRFVELPRRSGASFEVLLKHFSDDDERVRLLREHGWRVSKSTSTSDLFAYRDYIAGSRAEIGITKGAYVMGRSGWFSDRTATYLASGRPAIVQSTDIERSLTTGRGIICFTSLEEAVDAVRAVNADYGAHSAAAREFAAAHLDARKVLPPMLLAACSTTPAPSTAREVHV
jgi:hypothetical protein